jgi:hypothetical protein
MREQDVRSDDLIGARKLPLGGCGCNSGWVSRRNGVWMDLHVLVALSRRDQTSLPSK